MAAAPPTTRSPVARIRERRADALVAALWWVGAAAIAFFIAEGGLTTTSPVDYVYSFARIAGLVAAVLVMNQVLLISRVPWIERTLGHDRAAATHMLMGKVAFIAMLVHASLILIMTAHYDGRSVLAEIPALWDLGWFMVAAQAALGFFTLVVVTSLLIVRRRWKYENWHTVHLFVYLAIALVDPAPIHRGFHLSVQGRRVVVLARPVRDHVRLLAELSRGAALAECRPLWARGDGRHDEFGRLREHPHGGTRSVADRCATRPVHVVALPGRWVLA